MTHKIVYFVATLWLMVLLSACWGQKKVTQPTVPISPTPKVKPYEPSTSEQPTTPNPTATPTTTKPPIVTTPPSTTPTPEPPITVTPPKNDPIVQPQPTAVAPTAQITILLPLGSQQYSPSMSIDALSDKMQNGLEFYEGLLVAVDEWKSKGFTPEIKVYDTQNDPKQVEQLLAAPDLKKSDLIIGPLYNSELKPVAAFAKQHHIYHFSPISPSNQVAEDNPYYVVVNPSVEAHCKAIYEFAKKQPHSKIIAVASNKPNEIALSQRFMTFGNSPEGYSLPSVTSMLTADNIETKLSSTEHNIIVMTTFSELPVIEWVNNLYALRKKYDITLFGMPNWLDMPNIDLNYLAALDFHYTTEFWVNENGSEHQYFYNSFTQKYGNKPTKFAAKGYDLMRYVGDLWRAYQGDVANAIHITTRGVYTDFSFGTTIQGGNNTYLENREVHIVRYRPDFVLEKE